MKSVVFCLFLLNTSLYATGLSMKNETPLFISYQIGRSDYCSDTLQEGVLSPGWHKTFDREGFDLVCVTFLENSTGFHMHIHPIRNSESCALTLSTRSDSPQPIVSVTPACETSNQ